MPLEISQDFFLITPGNSMSGNSTCYFLNIAGNSISSTASASTCLVFFLEHRITSNKHRNSTKHRPPKRCIYGHLH